MQCYKDITTELEIQIWRVWLQNLHITTVLYLLLADIDDKILSLSYFLRSYPYKMLLWGYPELVGRVGNVHMSFVNGEHPLYFPLCSIL